MHFMPDADFDFQSSLQGGRLEFGGIVADFLFPEQRIIVNVQGPTHDRFWVGAKDKEQRGIFEELGYTYWEITDDDIYDEFVLEDWLRRHWNLASGRGGGTVSGSGPEQSMDEDEGFDPYLLELIYAMLLQIDGQVDAISADLVLGG
jgi:hypothetical protein